MTNELKQLLGAVRAAAERLEIEPHAMLAATQAVSVTRRGSTDWSEHDRDIAESCLGAFLAAQTKGAKR